MNIKDINLLKTNNRVFKLFSRYRGEISFTFSNYSSTAATMLSNIIAVKFITPREFGIINSVLLVLPYFAFMHFGVFNALNRNIAFYNSQGEHEKVHQFVDASFTVAIINSLMGILIFLLTIAYFVANELPDIYFISSFPLFLTLLLGPLGTHFEATYRSGQQFKTLGSINNKTSLTYLVFSFLPIILGYVGRVIANSIRILVNFYLKFRKQPIKFQGVGKISDIKELVKIGFPLLVGGYINGLFLASDKSVIVYYLGSEQLGYYSLSVLLMSVLAVIPTSINTLLYPKASAAYGISKSNYGLRSFYFKALSLNILIIFPIVLGLYFTLEPFVMWFLPQYQSGVAAAKINLLTCLTFIYYGPSIIMWVVRRNISYIIVNGLGLAIIWGVGIIVPTEHLNLEVIAYARFVVALALSVTVLGYSYYLTTIQEYRE